MTIFKRFLRLFRRKRASDLKEERKTILSVFQKTASDLDELRAESAGFIKMKEEKIAQETREMNAAKAEADQAAAIYERIMGIIQPTESEPIG